MLIDNPEEIKKHNSAVGAQVEMANVKSYLDDAINNYLIPAIGYATFTALVALKSSDPSDKEKRAIDLLQKSAIGFMIYNWADQGAVQISNSGIHVYKGANQLPASDKKIMALKKQNIAAGYNALEMAVSFLEDHLEDFPAYAGSSERSANLALLINTSAEFQNAGVDIRKDARLYQTLRITQRNVEDSLIEPTLGEIKQALHLGIIAKNLSAVQIELLKKVRKAVAFYTMAEAIPDMAISIDSTGIYELSETVGGISGNVENRSSAGDKRLAIAMSSFYAKAEAQMENIRKYLVAHAGDFAYAVPEEVNINQPGSNVYSFLS